MEWNSLLQELVDLVKSTAPELWRIAIQQVFVQAVGYGLGVVALLAFGLYFLWVAVQIKRSENYSQDEDAPSQYGLSLFASIALFSGLLILLYQVLGRLINPEFYAIELLINYVK